jgi:ribosomal protein S18 acetylase RimI-like enzyme
MRSAVRPDAPAVAIRRYAPADAPGCADIFDRAWRSGHDYAPRQIGQATFESETKDETMLVAERDGAVVGFVSVYLPESFVHHLYVDPIHQGRGIGETLLEQAVALAGGRASLKCQTRNRRALAFYRRLGWTEITAGTSEFGPWVAMRSPG